MLGFGRARTLAGTFAAGGRARFRFDGRGKDLPSARQLGLERRPLGIRPFGLAGFVGRSALDLGQAATGRLDFRLARSRRPAQRCHLLALGLPRGPQRLELCDGVGQLALGCAEVGLEVEVARRDSRRQRPSTHRQLGLGGRPLVEKAAAVAFERGQLRRQSRVPHLGRARRCASGVMRLASLPRDRRANRDLLGQGRHSRLAGRQRRHRVVDRCLGG